MKEIIPSNPQKLSFEIKRPALNTNVIIGKNILGKLDSLIDLSSYTQFIIITEKNIGTRFDFQLMRGLSLIPGRSIYEFNIKGGEINKTENNANKEIMARIFSIENPPVDRKTTLVLALGGGVVGDMAGYVAGKILREVDILQLPTTFLGMVDSSLGGKTAVNYNGITNRIGVNHLPIATIMDTATLKSLSDREFKSGMGELIKHAFLSPELFEFMSKIDPETLHKNDAQLIKILQLSANYKMGVVGRDFEEKTGVRQELNLGHTIGRALETAVGLEKLTHGEAVAIGTLGAILISYKSKLLSDHDTVAMIRLLKRFNLLVSVSDVDENLLWEAMGLDKKSVGGEPRFVLLKGIGKPKTDCKVDKGIIEEVLWQTIKFK